mmetsp:Transcript_73718/g.162955  ORF Transcript_73718/g.162955 Transcript_73718/m.162955 type:complete len:234 (+) Transcript_73718:2589-3290(+)
MHSVGPALGPTVLFPIVDVDVAALQWVLHVAVGASGQGSPEVILSAVAVPGEPGGNAEDIGAAAVRCEGPGHEALCLILLPLVALKLQEGDRIRLVQDPSLHHKIVFVRRCVDVTEHVVPENNHPTLRGRKHDPLLFRILGYQRDFAASALDDHQHTEASPLQELNVVVHKALADVVFIDIDGPQSRLLLVVLERHPDHGIGPAVGREIKREGRQRNHELGHVREVEIAKVQH